MKFLDSAVALLVLGLRLTALPGVQWPQDLVVTLAVYWCVQGAFPAHPRVQKAAFGAAVAWLTLIYALHQGRFTVITFPPP